MKAFKCDCCGEFYEDAPTKVVRVIFGSNGINLDNSFAPDICENCQVQIAKMFPGIKVRDKITKEEL